MNMRILISLMTLACLLRVPATAQVNYEVSGGHQRLSGHRHWGFCIFRLHQPDERDDGEQRHQHRE
jgi:hypothetical protein